LKVSGRAVSGRLVLAGLTKRYGDVPAVDAIDLDVAPGEFVTLLGPSGSGKTTTLMMVAGFTPPTSGDIRVDGRSITDMPPDRRNIGVVFQSYALFPHMNVAANVGFPLRMRRLPPSSWCGLRASATGCRASSPAASSSG
jgi:putative spermidine/putrescine transport system ATP-binding protein